MPKNISTVFPVYEPRGMRVSERRRGLEVTSKQTEDRYKSHIFTYATTLKVRTAALLRSFLISSILITGPILVQFQSRFSPDSDLDHV